MSEVLYRKSGMIPVVGAAEIVVVGGGPGGIGAAIMAARCGRKVLLVERAAVPGGMAAIGEVTPFMTSHLHGVSLDAPIYGEWVERMSAYQPLEIRQETQRRLGPYSDLNINKEYAALAAEDMLEAAGVTMLFHHALVDVIAEDRKIQAIVCHSRSGLTAVTGEIFIDATGDGELAALAHCTSEKGNDQGHCQPMTLCFKLANVELPPGNFWTQDEWWLQLQEKFRAAQAAGKLHCPRENIMIFRTYDDHVAHFNSTRVIEHDATNGLSYSEAERIARKQMREFLQWLRTDIPEFKNAQLLSSAAQIGVRESRRICGIARVTEATFQQRRHCPDGIARCNYPIDIHNPTGSGTRWEPMGADEFYEIPYGCLVPEDCDNLLIGCRAISADHAIHSSFRIMPTVCSIGQAAGVGAALAIDRKLAPRHLDGAQVRELLIRHGARL